MLRNRRLLLYWLPPVVWMTIIFVMSTRAGAASHSIGWVGNALRILEPEEVARWSLPEFSGANLMVRKLGHLTEYGILAALLLRALQAGRERLRPALLAAAWGLSALYAASDEFHQSFVPGRTPMVRDVGIDSTGAFIAVVLAAALFLAKALERRAGAER